MIKCDPISAPKRPVDPEDPELTDFEWTDDLEATRDTTCLPSDDEEDGGRTTTVHRHLCKKSSFTLDGSAPFDFGLKEKDVHKSPYLPSRSTLHIENAPSFTLDMLDENDPFESWDAGSRDSRHHHSPYISDLERKMSISMDVGKRKRWRKEPSKLRLSEVSSTLQIHHANSGSDTEESRGIEKTLRFQMEMNMVPSVDHQELPGMARVVSL